MAKLDIEKAVKKTNALLEKSYSQNLEPMKKTVAELKELSDSYQNSEIHLNYARGLTNILMKQAYLDGKWIINELYRLRDLLGSQGDFQSAQMIDMVLGKCIISCKVAESKRK